MIVRKRMSVIFRFFFFFLLTYQISNINATQHHPEFKWIRFFILQAKCSSETKIQRKYILEHCSRPPKYCIVFQIGSSEI